MVEPSMPSVARIAGFQPSQIFLIACAQISASEIDEDVDGWRP